MFKVWIEIILVSLSVIVGIFAVLYTVVVTLLCLGLAYVCGGFALYESMKLHGHREKVRVISGVILVAILSMASWPVRDWFEQGQPFQVVAPKKENTNRHSWFETTGPVHTASRGLTI